MDKSWRVILAFIGVFLAGTVSGVLVAPRIFRQIAERRFAEGPPRPQFAGQPAGLILIRRLTEKLELTPEQQEKIQPIEQRATEDLRRARRDAQKSTELVMDRVQVDISEVLTPDQRLKFEDGITKWRERAKKFMQDQEQRRRGDPGAPKRQREDQPPPPK